MSTIVAQTLSNGTVSTSTANCIQGSAKAWVNFDGTGTPAIRASYNVSSITDNGTGDYTVNMTNALADVNYVVTGEAGGTSGAASLGLADQVVPRTTTTFRLYTFTTAGSLLDVAQVNVAVFR